MSSAQIFASLAHFSLPRSSNNYRAKALHLSGTTTFLLLVIVFQGLLYFMPSVGIGVLGYAANISPDEVVRLTNEERISRGLGELRRNDELSAAALAKGADMLNKDYWAHVSPDGVEPWVFITRSGYEYRYAGENLARDFSNPKAAVDAWMASASHRENLLSSKYSEIGIAVVEGDLNGVDTTIIVQMFGTRIGAESEIVPVAAADEGGRSGISEEVQVVPEVSGVSELSNVNLESGVSVNTRRLSPLQLTKAISLVVTGIFLLVLVVDGIVVARRKVTRVSGRAFAHISFMGMIIAIILIAKAGQIF